MQRTVIIGGGVIGLCTAYYLNKMGRQVIILDENNFSEGCSHGNAGMITPSHFVPLSSPGMMAKGISMLFKSKSPFYIQPQMDRRLITWCLTFMKKSTVEHVRYAAPHLAQLSLDSKYRLANMCNSIGCTSFVESGLFMLYKNNNTAREEIEGATIAKKLGLDAKVMDTKDIQKFYPNLELDIIGGVKYADDAILDPKDFMTKLRLYLLDKVEMLPSWKVINFKVEKNKIIGVESSKGEIIEGTDFVIANGSWSSQLVRKVGIKMLIQPGKGYSFMQDTDKFPISFPTILTEAKVAITPLGKQIRVGGTLELGAYSPVIKTNKLKGIAESIPQYFNNIALPKPEEKATWFGLRPCSPDGLPYIGKSHKFSNLYIGTGHAMMGMTLGPATGNIISNLICEQKNTLDITAFDPNRYC